MNGKVSILYRFEFFPAVDSEVLAWTKCGNYFCFNGGTCQNDTCQCSEGFGGDYCLYTGECVRKHMHLGYLHAQCHTQRYTLHMCMWCSSLVMCVDCANSTNNGGKCLLQYSSLCGGCVVSSVPHIYCMYVCPYSKYIALLRTHSSSLTHSHALTYKCMH